MKKFKNILIIVVIGIVVVAVVAMMNKKDIEEVNVESEKEKLIMVTEAGFAPYEFYEGEEIVGVDVEIAKRLLKKQVKN